MVKSKTFKMTETMDLERLKLLVDGYDYIPWPDMKSKAKHDKEAKKDGHVNYKAALQKYYDVAKAGNGSVEVTYKQINGSRYYADTRTIGTSLQGMPRIIRHTIGHRLVDLDFKASHPTIVHWLMGKHGLKNNELTDYLKNRVKRNEELTSCLKEGDGKGAFIKMLNGGKVEDWEHFCPKSWMLLEREVCEARNKLVYLDEFKEQFKLAEAKVKEKPWKSLEGSVISHICCKYEAEALNEFTRVSRENGIQVNGNCFDGVMVDKIDDDSLVKGNSAVFKKTNIRLEAVIKPMNDGLTDEQLEDLKVKVENGDVLKAETQNDEIRQHTIQLFGNQSEEFKGWCEDGLICGENASFHGHNCFNCQHSWNLKSSQNECVFSCSKCNYQIKVPVSVCTYEKYPSLSGIFVVQQNINNVTNIYTGATGPQLDDLVVKPKGMTHEQDLVWEAVNTGGGKARLFAHVANGTIKYDDEKTAWFYEDYFWRPCKDGSKKCKNRLRKFEIDKVMPFVKEHKPNDVKMSKILAFDGDTKMEDLEKMFVMSTIIFQDFVAKIDQNPDWLSFTNGVVDLSKPKSEWFTKFEDIPNAQDLFLSKSVKYPFPISEGPNVPKLRKLFEEIQPNEENRDYMLKSIAVSLHGSKLSRNVHLYSGEGRNGKTLLSTLLSASLGQYYIEVPSSYLQTPSDGTGGPDPLTLELRGKRCAVTSEPSDGKKMQAEKLKKLGGGDRTRARDLWEAGDLETFALNLHLIILCNKKPPIDGDDGGVKDRLRNIPFKSRFVDKGSDVDTDNHVYPADEKLKVQITDWAADFMWLLLNEYYDHDWDGTPPDDVVECTREYIMDNNVFEEFVHEYYSKCTDSSVYSPRPEVIALFKEKHPTKLTDRAITQKLDVVFNGCIMDSKSRRGGKDQKPGWKGWTLKKAET
jgi:phage/plasmid-associated DNA primase